jgi:hypothetical protein
LLTPRPTVRFRSEQLEAQGHLLAATSDREASTEPDIALASVFFDEELSRSWYAAEDLTTLKESGAALAPHRHGRPDPLPHQLLSTGLHPRHRAARRRRSPTAAAALLDQRTAGRSSATILPIW